MSRTPEEELDRAIAKSQNIPTAVLHSRGAKGQIISKNEAYVIGQELRKDVAAIEERLIQLGYNIVENSEASRIRRNEKEEEEARMEADTARRQRATRLKGKITRDLRRGLNSQEVAAKYDVYRLDVEFVGSESAPQLDGASKIGLGCGFAIVAIPILWVLYAIIVSAFGPEQPTGPELYCARQGITCDRDGDPIGSPAYHR